MAIPKETQEKETGQVVMFPARISLGEARRNAGKAAFPEAEIDDLRKYHQDNQPDDYVRRMVVNVIAFAFIVMLTLSGIWLVDQFALLRKQQDCVLSGGRNCAELDKQIRDIPAIER